MKPYLGEVECPRKNKMCDLHGDCPHCGKNACGKITIWGSGDGPHDEPIPLQVACLRCKRQVMIQ